jgi:hypothetical protein
LANRIDIPTPDENVFVHHSLPLGHGLGIPIRRLSALAIHEVKAEVFRGWYGWIKTLRHCG